MTYSAKELAEISRIEARLETSNVKGAYLALIDWAETRKGLFLLPISRGAFSAIHMATRQDARPYADCEFAFKAAKTHLRWWFRKPCFASGLWGSDVVLAMFPDAGVLKSGEIAMDLHDRAEVEKLCNFLASKI